MGNLKNRFSLAADHRDIIVNCNFCYPSICFISSSPPPSPYRQMYNRAHKEFIVTKPQIQVRTITSPLNANPSPEDNHNIIHLFKCGSIYLFVFGGGGAMT